MLKNFVPTAHFPTPAHMPNDVAKIPSHLLSPIAFGRFSVDEAREVVEAVGKVAVDIGDGLTLLHMAAQHELVEVAEFLIERGHPLDCQTDGVAETPLDQAAWRGSLEVAELLVLAGANINCTTTGGYTPLHRCAFYGHGQLAARLLLFGASTTIQDGDGKLAYECAMEEGHDRIASLLEPILGPDGEDMRVAMYARNNPNHPLHRPEAAEALRSLSRFENEANQPST